MRYSSEGDANGNDPDTIRHHNVGSESQYATEENAIKCMPQGTSAVIRATVTVVAIDKYIDSWNDPAAADNHAAYDDDVPERLGTEVCIPPPIPPKSTTSTDQIHLPEGYGQLNIAKISMPIHKNTANLGYATTHESETDTRTFAAVSNSSTFSCSAQESIKSHAREQDGQSSGWVGAEDENTYDDCCGPSSRSPLVLTRECEDVYGFSSIE